MKTAGQVFDEWASDRRAGRMGNHHWPLVKQGHRLIPRDTGRYLEIGVGSGYSLRSMATHQYAQGQCLGIDVSSRMVELAQSATSDLGHVRVEEADFLDPKVDLGGPFSTIFSMEVFYYFESIQAGIEKASSLLEPGGRLMVMVDFYEENKVNHGWPEVLDTAMCLWSREEYRVGFQRAGFEEVRQYTFVNEEKPDRDPEDTGTLCTVGIRT